MNFTFLPSSSVLIHSSSGIFVSLQARSAYVASIVVRCQKSRRENEKSPSRDLAFEPCTKDYNGELPLLPVFARTNNFLNRLTEGGGECSEPPAVLHASTQQQSELPHSVNQLPDLCSLDQPNHSFLAILYISRR